MSALSLLESSCLRLHSVRFGLYFPKTNKQEMKMSEAEIVQSYWNGHEMAMDSFLAYLTILSGYLVAALL
jgi:hypothetical protein